MKVYIYKGVEYHHESLVRKVIFKKERLVLPKIATAEGWAKYGVTYLEVEDVLTDEQLAKQVRYKRDILLRKSDFYVMPDYPSKAEDLADVRAYRQSLRDITKQGGFPKDITWPNVPSVLS